MKKRIITGICFIVLLLGAGNYTQEVLKAKFMGDSTTIVDGFYAEKKNSIDVVFIGSSNCFCTINPLVLYENYGITSYDFASSSQPMSISYLYAKEVFKHQKPKVVALEINSIPGYGIEVENESSMRWGLTQIPFSKDKLECLTQSGYSFDQDYMSYIFPVLRYHERWKEISKNDFVYPFRKKTNYEKGYLHTDEAAQEPVYLDDYNSEGESWLEDDMISCLDRFVELCERNGAKVVFFKAPKKGWYAYQTRVVQDYASQKGIPVIDYNAKVTELEMNPATDFRDDEHLNNQGSYKVSDDMGRYLKEHYELPDYREANENNSFDEALFYYDRFKPQAFMEAASVMECNELLKDKKDYIMIVTYRGGKNTKTKKEVLPHQWVYADHKLVLDKEWKENGVVVKDIGKVQLVLQKKGAGMQTVLNHIAYPAKTDNWSVVVYDMLIDEVVAELGFAE